MWLLIISELVVFGAIFAGFGIIHLSEPQMYLQSQNQLDRVAGGLSTMVLVTSGFCAAVGVHYQLAKNDTKKVRLWLFLASLSGGVFLYIKFLGYFDMFAQGISTEINSFFMLYFLATGFHALHVVFGIIILGFVGWKNSNENVITGVAFWHMVDLIWIILFPVAYLVR